MAPQMAGPPTSGRVRPILTPETEFFWEGTRRGKLLIQRCSSCRVTRHPPGPACARCHSLEWEPVDLGTEGRLHSFTVHHRPLPPGFEQPFIVGLIEFDDGTRMVTNVIGIEEEDLVLDEVLEVVFVDQDEGWTAPLFRRPAPR